MRQTQFTIIILSFLSVNVAACSCGLLSKLDEATINEAHLFVVGQVLEVELLKEVSRIEAKLILTKAWKGAEINDTIVIATSNSGASCGLSFSLNEQWYIASFSNETGVYIAGLCGRSRNLSRNCANHWNLFERAWYGLRGFCSDKKNFRKDKRVLNKWQKRCKS